MNKPPPLKINQRSITLLLTAAYLVWALLFIAKSAAQIDTTNYHCLADDAMISMRYAYNWASGNGLVWNPGERVEGYTNPLMVAVMAATIAATSKFTAIYWIQMFGMFAVVATAVVASKIYAAIGGIAKHSWMVLAGIFSIYTLSYWALLGMETGLVSALLAAGIAIAITPDPTKQKAAALGGTLALLYLARPDTIVFGGIILTFVALPELQRRKIPTNALLAAATLATVVISHLLWRHSYYGQWQPNTALLKLGGFPLKDRLINGLSYIGPFIPRILPLAILASLSVAINYSKERLLIIALIASSAIYQVYVGGDGLAVDHWRMLSPIIPLIIILAADGAIALTTKLSDQMNLAPAIATAAMLAAGVTTYNWYRLPEQLLLIKPHTTDWNEKNINTAFAINALTKETATVAVVWAGTIPYFTARRSIDLLGKCDPHIAALAPDLKLNLGRRMPTLPGHNKYDLNYSIKGKLPTYIQTGAWGNQSLGEWLPEHYSNVTIGDTTLMLKKSSPDVNWELIEP